MRSCDQLRQISSNFITTWAWTYFSLVYNISTEISTHNSQRAGDILLLLNILYHRRQSVFFSSNDFSSPSSIRLLISVHLPDRLPEHLPRFLRSPNPIRSIKWEKWIIWIQKALEQIHQHKLTSLLWPSPVRLLTVLFVSTLIISPFIWSLSVSDGLGSILYVLW